MKSGRSARRGAGPALAALGVAAAVAGFLLIAPSAPTRDVVAPGTDDVALVGSQRQVDVPPAAPSPEDRDAQGETGADQGREASHAQEVAPATEPAAAANGGAQPSTARGDALRAEAREHLSHGRAAEALAALEAAVEADPASAANHGELGDLLLKLTAIDRALYHLEQSAHLDPGSADRWIALANAWYRKPDPGAAWKAERRAREAEPGLVIGRDESGLRIRIGGREPDAR